MSALLLFPLIHFGLNSILLLLTLCGAGLLMHSAFLHQR